MEQLAGALADLKPWQMIVLAAATATIVAGFVRRRRR
jgi:hypothetical protein